MCLQRPQQQLLGETQQSIPAASFPNCGSQGKIDTKHGKIQLSKAAAVKSHLGTNTDTCAQAVLLTTPALEGTTPPPIQNDSVGKNGSLDHSPAAVHTRMQPSAEKPVVSQGRAERSYGQRRVFVPSLHSSLAQGCSFVQAFQKQQKEVTAI